LLISGNGNRWQPAGVNAWLRALGIFGQRSHEKRVPVEAFRLPNRQVAVLLRHLWATDGCVWVSERNSATAIHYSTNSPQLASDVAALLLRLGIVSRTAMAKKRSYRTGFLVHVSGATHQLRFLECVGAFGPKVAAARRLSQRLKTMRPNTNVDTLPIDVFRDVRARMRAKGISMRQMARVRGTVFAGDAHFDFSPSRATLLDYAERLDDTSLFAQATSDLFWDSVVGSTDAPTLQAFSVAVPHEGPWLSDGILVVGHGHAPAQRAA
jgi:replicative DNA helicase